jgi:hypothetical protein
MNRNDNANNFTGYKVALQLDVIARDADYAREVANGILTRVGLGAGLLQVLDTGEEKICMAGLVYRGEPLNSSPNAGASTLSPKYFNSLVEYKHWASSASQQEREAYWESLSDLDYERLYEALAPEEDCFPTPAQAEPQCNAVTPIDPRPDSFDTYEEYEAFYPDALVLTKEKWRQLKAGLY